MSLLRISFKSDTVITKNGFLSIIAHYSRRSNSKDSDSYYKVISEKANNVRDQCKSNYLEGGPNWEIFNPKGNRFYLPNSLGPGWQNPNSTISLNVNLSKLINFYTKDSDKLYLDCKQCPKLIRNNLQDLFPTHEVSNKLNELTLITLSYQNHTDVEYGAKNFVISAREICRRLIHAGYWADFMNPFSGKPFYMHHNVSKVNEFDKRFRGFGVKYEDLNNCLVISSEVEGILSGSIFTEAPKNRDDLIKTILLPKIFDDICNGREVDDDD